MKVRAVIVTGILLFVSQTALAGWDGKTDWARRTEMSTAASGVVDKVLVRAGERVKKNTVLLQLEQATLRARIEQAKAELEHGKLLHGEAKKELDRADELYARTLLSDHDLNVAKLAYAEANAAYQRTQADMLEAQEALRDSELVAPFEAIVLERRVQPAETVVQQLRAEPMVVLASASEMLVRIMVDEDDAAELNPGKSVQVDCDGKDYSGTVEAVSYNSAGKGSSGGESYVVEVLFTTDKPLRPGMSAKVSLP